MPSIPDLPPSIPLSRVLAAVESFGIDPGTVRQITLKPRSAIVQVFQLDDHGFRYIVRDESDPDGSYAKRDVTIPLVDDETAGGDDK